MEIQVVVAGGAIGAQRHRDTGFEQPLHGAEAGGQLEVGFRAMHHAGRALCKPRDLGVLHVNHVYRHQPMIEEPQAIQPGDRPLAVSAHAVRQLAGGFVKVNVDRNVELVGEGSHPRQWCVGNAVGSVGSEGGTDQRVVAETIVHLGALGEILVGVAGPDGGKIQDDEAEGGAHAARAGDLAGLVGVKVHVVETGYAAAHHLRAGEPGAVAHQGIVYPALLRRPDMVLEPLVERQVVGDAPEQRHGGMGMGVDEAGDEHLPGEARFIVCAIARARLGVRQQRQDAPLMHGDAVIGEYLTAGLHRDHPGGAQKRVDVLHDGDQFLAAGASARRLAPPNRGLHMISGRDSACQREAQSRASNDVLRAPQIML